MISGAFKNVIIAWADLRLFVAHQPPAPNAEGVVLRRHIKPFAEHGSDLIRFSIGFLLSRAVDGFVFTAPLLVLPEVDLHGDPAVGTLCV